MSNILKKSISLLLSICLLVTITITSTSCRRVPKDESSSLTDSSGESNTNTQDESSSISDSLIESNTTTQDESSQINTGDDSSNNSDSESGSGSNINSGGSSNPSSSNSNSSSSSSSNVSTTTPTPQPTAAKIALMKTPSGLEIPTKEAIGLKSTKLRYMHLGGGVEYAPGGVTYEALKKYYGVTIEPIHSTPDQLALQLSQLIAANEAPDLVDGSGFFPAFPMENLVQPVDGLINYDDVPIMKPYKQAYNSYLYNNKRWYIVSSSYMTSALYYNTKMFEDAGLQDPRALYEKNEWDWNALLDAARKLKNLANRRWGIMLCQYQSSRFVFTTGENYVKIQNGKLVNTLNNAPFERAYQFLFDLTLTYKVAAPNREIGSVHTLFDNGNSAMLMSAGWMATNGLYFQNLKKTDTLGYVPMPRDPQNSKLFVPGTSFNRFIPVGAKNIDAAKAFVYASTAGSIEQNISGTVSFDQNYQRTLTNAPETPRAVFEKMARYTNEYNRLPSVLDAYETVLDVDRVYIEMIGEGGTSQSSFQQVVARIEPEMNNIINIINAE